MKPTKNRVYCRDCGRVKMLFETEKQADTFIRFNREEIEERAGYCPARSYFCIICNGWHVTSKKEHGHLIVSIRQTTGIKLLYTTIATVTMNLIVSAAIVLLNPYVTVYISYKIPPFALSVHIPDVSTSIYVEVDSKVLLGLPFCDKAFVR